MAGPLVVVVGETASGKSALALDIAKRWSGEVIAADSRTVYRGLNIGTAKPSLAEQQQIKHHLIDILEPDETFTAADFKRLAQAAIANIEKSGHLPIVVGGTGLYVDALLYDFQFRVAPTNRSELNELSVDQLQQLILECGLILPNNPRNPRHLIRVLETKGQVSQRGAMRSQTLVVGLTLPREELNSRIEQRVEAMFAAGLEQEVGALAKHYGWSAPALKTIGYQEFEPYFAGQQTLDKTKQQIVRSTQAYAKQQRTWFKRNKNILWFDNSITAIDYVGDFLNKPLV